MPAPILVLVGEAAGSEERLHLRLGLVGQLVVALARSRVRSGSWPSGKVHLTIMTSLFSTVFAKKSSAILRISGEMITAALRSPVKSGRGGVAAACAPPPS